MIIVNEKGGLGNQLFQYSLYLTLNLAGKNAKICTEHYKWASTLGQDKIQTHGQRFLVEEVFDTCAVTASEKEINHLSTTRMDFFSRARRKIGLRKKTHLIEEEMNYPSIEDLIALDNVFLDGYWQRFDYYKGIEQLIRAELHFRNNLEGRNAQLERDLQLPNAVTIHVRRNDYLSLPIYVVQDKDYYRSAMMLAANKLKKPIFYCFSDDIDWCKENLSDLGYNIYFINWNTGADSYKDMQLMASCRTNIITNSSFSLWSAWLGDDCKTVYRPAHYYTDIEMDQKVYWPENWIKVMK